MKQLQLSDLVFIDNPKGINYWGRVTGRSNEQITCVHYKNFELGGSPDFSKGFRSFITNQIIKNAGQITNKELEEQYPEYII